jgi:enoyl-CoA hydratase
MADDPTYDNVLVDIDGPVATITLNRPEQLNAMSRGLLNDLYQALRDLNPGDAVRVIRLRGAGRAFCPGYDLGPTTGVYAGGGSKRKKDGPGIADYGESSIAIDRESLREMIDRWLWMWNFRKPVIAQVHGYCLSGGLDLIGACDIVWAAEGTLFGHPAARGMGIPVTVGLLPLKMGAAATKELLFTGDLFDAEEAKELGLIRRVVPADELDERTLAFCRRVAMNPLDVLTAAKHVTNRTYEIMGSRAAAFEGADFDAIAHLTPSMAEFGRRVANDGLRAALAWRDSPYTNGPAADHDAAAHRRAT